MAAKKEMKETKDRIYIVKDDDSLSKIAKNELGASHRFCEIMKLNGLPDTRIKVGQKLNLPLK